MINMWTNDVGRY
jgi:protein SEY1